MIVAALDLGSNSFHLLLAEYDGQQLFGLERFKRRVQLGAGLDADNYLSQAAIQRGLNCLRDFLGIINEFEVKHLHSAATNTLRKARNARSFITEAEAILMHPLPVVGGAHEADIVFRGVIAERPLTETGLIIDIGGGSTEFAVGTSDQDHPDSKISLQMGCVSFARRYFSEGGIYSENMLASLAAARHLLIPELQRFQDHSWHSVIGASGTMQAVANLCQHRYQSAPGKIHRDHVQALYRDLILARHVDRLKLPPEEAKRRDILPSGLTIIQAIMEILDIEIIETVQSSLCEGLLVSAYNCGFSRFVGLATTQ